MYIQGLRRGSMAAVPEVQDDGRRTRMKICRREFIATVGTLSAMLPRVAPAAGRKRPNILFIIFTSMEESYICCKF